MKTMLSSVPRFFVACDDSCVACDARARQDDSVYCRECDEVRVLQILRYALATDDDE